ncbi:MAG: inositol phosphorylceramide synthase [Planctomycetes bacterium]|nr:inositol phosphorylceramide synthase [Planctomycetota bacterium]
MKTFLAVFQVLLIAAFTVLFVRLAIGRGAARASANVWRELPRRPTFRLAVAIWLCVFLFDLAQTASDQALTRSLRIDFTPFLYEFEGTLVASIQQFLLSAPLTWLLTFAYLILFPALLFGSAHAYDRLDDPRRVRMTAYVYALNYVFCLPFYLFFPVGEPFWYSPSLAQPLMDNVSPHLLNILRPMSGPDNCFPSYHTSLTVSLVLIAWSSSSRRFRWAAACCGALILLSTIYLAFHWVLDVAAGVLAGWFVFEFSRRLADVPFPFPILVPARARSKR